MKNPIIKSTLSLFALAIFLLTFSNCEKLLDALQIEATFDQDFSINITENDELIFFDEKIIDLSSNQEFVDNKDMIDFYTVKEIYYVITGYEGEAGILGSGVITFKDGDDTIGDAITQTNVDFAALLTSGEKTTLPVTDATKSQLADVLKNKLKFTVKLEGIVTDKPAYIDIKMSAVIGANVQR